MTRASIQASVRAGERRQLLPPHGQEHASTRRDRLDGGGHVIDLDPAVARLHLPRRTRQHQPGGRPLPASGLGMAGDRRGEGMRRIHHSRNAPLLQICRQPFGPAEPADADFSRQSGWRPGPPGERRDDTDAGKPARQRRRLRRAAQDQHAGVHRRESGPALKPALAVEDENLHIRTAITQNPKRHGARPRRDQIGKRHSGGDGPGQHLIGGIGRPRLRHQLRRRSQFRQPVGQPREIDLTPPRMQIEEPLSQLGQLAEPSRDGDARHRVPPQVFQHAAREIAHIQQSQFGKAMNPLHRLFGSRSGRTRDMIESHWPAPHRCRDGWSVSRRSTRTARRSPSSPGSTARRRCQGAGSRSSARSPPRPAPTPRSPHLRHRRTPPPASATASVIIRRGTGLIAGSPGGIGRPSFVTMPTPSPARNTTPLPASPRLTVAMISAPWVTSGSSPASLITPAAHSSAPRASQARAKAGVSPPGRRMVTGSGNSPVSRAV